MNNEKVIRRSENDKQKAKDKQNFREVMELCNFIGSQYANNAQYEQAIEQHKEELEYGRKLNDNLSIAIAYRRLGECYSEMGQFDNALNFHNKYLMIVDKLNDTVETQRAYATLGRTYFMQYSADAKRYSNAIQHPETAHLKALSLTDHLKEKLAEKDYAEMRCRALLNLGLIYDQKDDEEQCSSYFKRAINLARNFGFEEDLHRCEVSLAAFYSKIGEYSQAIKMYNSAVLSAKKLKSKIDLYETLMGKGYTLLQIRDYESARHCFKKAFYIYKHECDEIYEAKRCLQLVKQVIIKIRELTNCSSNERKITICDKLGDLFAELNCYSVALEYYNDELGYALDESYDKSKLSPIYLSLAQTYLDNRQYTEALYNFKKEIECNRGNPKEEILTSLKIIETKCAIHRNNEEIIAEFKHLLENLCVNNQLKKLVYKRYLDFLKEIDDCDLYSDLIQQIKSKLDTLNKEPNTEDDGDSSSREQFNSQSTNQQEDDEVEVVLSDVSELTSDSETEENEELVDRRSRRTKKGLDEKRNEKGETPLHRACIEGNLAMVEKLIEKGHKINPRDNCGWLPIHEASNHGRTEIVELLIKHKAWINDPGGRGCDGTTPIHDACTNGHLGVIRLLLRAGANVTCVDYHSNTPLDCLKEYLKRSIGSLTSFEKKDFQLLVNEMKEVMIKKGFNEKKSLKRPFSSINEMNTSLDQDSNLLEELSNKIDRNRSRSATTAMSSPPRKTNRTISHQISTSSSSSTSNLRKNIDHSIDQPPTTTNSRPRSAPRIDSLIDEDNLIVDDWLEDDIGLNTKRRPISDPFERKENREYNRSSKPRSYSTKNQDHHKSPIKSTLTTTSLDTLDKESFADCNFDSDIEMDDEHRSRPPQTSNTSEQQYEMIDDENSSSSLSDILPVHLTSTTELNNYSKKVKRKQTKIKNYFNLDAQTMKSSVDGKMDDVILVSANVDTKKGSSFELNNQQQSSKAVVVSKLKVHVHIDGMILLVPLSNERASIGWLMNETVERYYSFKKIRPVIRLKTMDGALLSNDDQVVDVLTNMEVKVEIDSFNIKPINELYNELCESENVKVVNELDYEFRISMASGCLNLRNCFLDAAQCSLVVSSLKMQSKIRVLDASYSNLLKLDTNNNFIRTIFSGLANLEILNLECTGLSKSHLIEMTKYRASSKLTNLNLNYNLLLNSEEIICELIENNTNLCKLFLQYTDLTEQLILNLRLNQLLEKRPSLQIHIDTLKKSKNFLSCSFMASSLGVLETNECDYLEFNKKLFIA